VSTVTCFNKRLGVIYWDSGHIFSGKYNVTDEIADPKIADPNRLTDNATPNSENSASVLNSDVLTSLLSQDAVPMDTLHNRYGPLLELVRILIGVVPNCDRYLEIWPPAFRTYNLIVPNFLNLPFSIFGVGNAPKEMVGLGMYVASRSAQCPYCSAHTCSYALRRGSEPQKVAQALLGGDQFNDQELATIAIARSLSTIPCSITALEKQALQQNFSQVEAEWIVLGIAMMGFLNKFMDAIGVELESSTVAETHKIMGSDWSPGKAGRQLDYKSSNTVSPTADTFATKFSVIRYAPTALKLDGQWQRGVPNRWPAVGKYLQEHTGYNFPILSQMKNARAIRAIATVLRDNLDKEKTTIGIETKLYAGIIFASSINNNALTEDLCQVIKGQRISAEHIDVILAFAVHSAKLPPTINPKLQALLSLARAASPSPAEITSEVVSTCSGAQLSSESIVELITWLSVLQMMHRLGGYFDGNSLSTT